MSNRHKPRLAFVCPFGLKPKATVAVRALPMAAALVQRGHAVALFVPPWDDSRASGQRQERDGVPVVQVSTAGGHPATLARMVKEVLHFRPDVVHFFRPKGYPTAIAQLWHWRRLLGGGSALVLDADDWEGPGGWNDVLPYPRWQKRLFAAQERWAYRHADAVTVASEALRTIALSLGVPGERAFHVPNALPQPLREPDPAAVIAVRRALGLDGETVLLYTRFVEFPPEWPLTFLAQLRQLRPGAKLLVLGEGLQGQHELLRSAARGQGVGTELVLAGWPGRESMPAYVRAAGVAVVPFEDSLLARTKSSYKLLELMSLATPIVASAVGENVPYLGYGEAGMLLEPGLNAGKWALAVAELLADAPRCEQLSRAAAARLRREYLWPRLVGRVEQAYECIL